MNEVVQQSDDGPGTCKYAHMRERERERERERQREKERDRQTV